MSKSITYSDAGVSIDAANAAVEKIKGLARATFNARTLSEIGSFGGMFDGAFPGMSEPVLVASADGVGTKLKVAFMTGVPAPGGGASATPSPTTKLVQAPGPSSSSNNGPTAPPPPDVTLSAVE